MTISVRSAAALLLGALVLSLPLFVHAVGMDADARCVASQCTMTPTPGRPLCPQVVCQDNTNGFSTVGFCATPTNCKGVTAGGKGLDSALGQLGQLLGQLMGKLMQGQPSQPSTPTTPPFTPTGCQGTTFQTSEITQLSNPCAQYVAPTTPITGTGGTTTLGGGCDTLSQLLGTCGDTSTTNTNDNTNVNNNTVSTQTQTQTQTQTTGLTNVFNASGTSAGLGVPGVLVPTQGTGGDLVLTPDGATIYGYSLNPANNTGVAGFFGGGNSFTGQPQGFAASMCADRPWARGLLGALLPDSFFDGMCTLRGYRVGPPPVPQAPVVQLQQTPPMQKPAATTPSTSTPTVQPQVHIWASPASVALDTRTTIFWSAQGVTGCIETSPDGSFNHNTLSGGAATVPLLGATVFTISCLDADGNPVTDNVTVNIKI